MPDIFVSPHHSEKKHVTPTSLRHSPISTMFSSFVHQPRGMRFETQEETEEVLLFLRQHLVTTLPWIVSSVMLFLVPFLVMPFLGNISLFATPIPISYLFFFPIVWYMGLLGFTLTHFLHWYFNIYIITNQRVIDIDFNNLLFKAISAAELSKIEDVTYQQGGFFHSFFDFGDVFIQTAGTVNNFEFEAVASPEKVVRQISSLIE